MSAHSNVVLRFNQFFRWFRGPGSSTSEPPSSVWVSNNGGDTFTKFEVNQNIAINQATAPDDVILLDISSVAANSDEVVIKFVFEGDAYYWMIDDVYLLGDLPQNNLTMDRNYFAPTALFTPQAYAVADTFAFAARISNKGGNEITDAYMKVDILDGDLNVYFADSILLDPIEVGTENRVVQLPFVYVPENLDPNQYFIRYTLFQPGTPDFDPSDNVRVNTFLITDNNFWQSGVLRTYASPNFGGPNIPWAWGSYFITSDAVQDSYAIESVEFSVEGFNDENDLDGNYAEINVMEILDFSIGSQGTSIDDGSSNIITAFGFAELTPADDREILVLTLEDYITGEPVVFPIENGKSYMVAVSVGANVSIGYDNQFNNVPFSLGAGTDGSSALHWGGEFVGGTFGGTMPFIRLNLTLGTSVDERPLPEHAVQVFPNPAGNNTNISLSFSQSTDVTITLADINGRIINFQNLSGIVEHNHNMDLSRLAAGTYIVRIATPEGTATRKLSVIK
jgi:hypothetical protein